MFIRTFALSLIFLGVFGATSLLAAPSGGRITAGDGELSNPLNIIQHSKHLATSWESFDIASGEVVNITQPSASALISIKVRNGTETNIHGTLNANGKVALENPAGVLFGAGSVVNVGGLLATAGAVQADGVINAPLGEVHLQSLSNNNVVNVGGTIEAQRIIVEGANEVKLGSTATLTAAKEVLVGGDFQGKGEITNSQKTIVESGAMITSPRVIIWSDVSTNFQGNINAEGGFVEVSGKQSLASFDILKIRAAELLLDPAAITIMTATPNNDAEIYIAPPDEDNGTDGQDDGTVGEDEGALGSTFIISAAAIQSYVGDVSLTAKTSISVRVEISKTNGGLTLTAPTISLFRSITVSGDLTVRATTKLQFLNMFSTITLVGTNVSVASLTQAGFTQINVLNFRASGDLTIEGRFGNKDINTFNLFAGKLNRDGTIITNGTIMFMNSPTLTAKEINLLQSGAPFAEDSPATFIVFVNGTPNGKPKVNYNGGGEVPYIAPLWATCAAGATTCSVLEPTEINVEQDGDINLEVEVADNFFFVDEDGLLDLTNTNLTLITKGNIIFPAGIKKITAISITLTAANIGTENDSGVFIAGLPGTSTDGLTIEVEEILSLSAGTLTSAGALTLIASTINLNTNIEVMGDLTLTASTQIKFSEDDPITLSGVVVSLASPLLPADEEIGNQDLTIIATGVLTMSGEYNIGTGSVSLTFGGTRAQAPNLPRLFTNDLTLIHTGTEGLAYNSWMADEGRNLTLISQGNISNLEGISLGITPARRGSLTIRGETISPALAARSIILRAKDISLTATSENNFVDIGESDDRDERNDTHLTLEASGNITINASEIDFNLGSLFDFSLTLAAAGEIIFVKNTNIRADNITLGGAVKAEQHALLLEARNQLNFATSKATTIEGANITFISAMAGTASNKDLTLTASGTITLQGRFDVGNHSTNGGTITLTAESLTAGSSDGTGRIIFTKTGEALPSLKARAVTLTQNGAVFPTPAPATFTLTTAEGKPVINYTGLEAQGAIVWAIFRNTDFDLEDELEDNGELEGKDSDDSSGNIVIDLTTEADERDKDFIISTTEDLILPDEMVMVKAKIIAISAKNIRNENGEGITQPLVLEATEMVIIDANIVSTKNIIIKAPNVIFSGSKPVRLSGSNIMIELPDDMDMPSDMPAANNQNVELVATGGDIMLNNNINVGFGTLKLEANRIMTASADVMIMGNRVEVDSGTDNSIGAGLTIISMNDIRLLGNIETGGNVVLRAGGSIITPDAATTIEATGAGNAITFQQKYALRQSFGLTLKAAGDIRIIGRLDRGTAGITLDGGSLDLTRASLSAGEITCRPIPVGASAGACQ